MPGSYSLYDWSCTDVEVRAYLPLSDSFAQFSKLVGVPLSIACISQQSLMIMPRVRLHSILRGFNSSRTGSGTALMSLLSRNTTLSIITVMYTIYGGANKII